MGYLGLTAQQVSWLEAQKRAAAVEKTKQRREERKDKPSAPFYIAPPTTQQFDVADWTQPMYAQPSATTVVSGGAAPTTVLKLGPGQYQETGTYAPEVELGAGIRDLYSEAASKDLQRGIDLLQRLPAQTVPVQEMYGPSPTPQLPTMASQQQAEHQLEQAQAPQAIAISAAVPAEEKKSLGLVWLIAAGVVGLMLSRRGHQ